MSYVNYLGRTVRVDKFRAFIYAADGSEMLVDSWSEYKRYIDSRKWFSTIEEAQKVSKKLEKENKEKSEADVLKKASK